MALFQTGFRSSALQKQTSFNAIFPEEGFCGDTPYPVVYLLHGLSDDHSIWLRRSNIERYASEYGFAVIMPDGGRSFYTDMKHGDAYFTAIAEELPRFVERMFPVSRKREDTFIAGLSMGGYGALKIALRYPERFAAAGIMSAVTDIVDKFSNEVFDLHMWQDIFGSPEETIRDGNDLFTLAEKVSRLAEPPAVIQFCGTEDFLLKDNRKLNSALESLNWRNYLYSETPGTHCWPYWDKHIQDILKFFKGENKNG